MKRLSLLVSGRGSNMAAIIDACRHGHLAATVELVISNHKTSPALTLAQANNIKTAHLNTDTHASPETLDRAMRDTLRAHDIDLVVLAGFMQKIGPHMLAHYKNRIINIHPSLLPKYGGQGMYGMNVHRAVMAAGEKESGATVHVVNDAYDAGTILAQQVVAVASTETPESLAIKVLQVEHVLFAETIQKIIDGRILLPTD